MHGREHRSCSDTPLSPVHEQAKSTLVDIFGVTKKKQEEKEENTRKKKKECDPGFAVEYAVLVNLLSYS